MWKGCPLLTTFLFLLKSSYPFLISSYTLSFVYLYNVLVGWLSHSLQLYSEKCKKCRNKKSKYTMQLTCKQYAIDKHDKNHCPLPPPPITQAGGQEACECLVFQGMEEILTDVTLSLFKRVIFSFLDAYTVWIQCLVTICLCLWVWTRTVLLTQPSLLTTVSFASQSHISVQSELLSKEIELKDAFQEYT